MDCYSIKFHPFNRNFLEGGLRGPIAVLYDLSEVVRQLVVLPDLEARVLTGGRSGRGSLQRAGQEVGGVVSQASGVSRTFEGVLVRQCAPTLAGIKPGSIFCFKHASLEVPRQKVCQWNERLSPLGLEVQILLERPNSGSVIVYVYRRNHLEQLLTDHAYQEFLRNTGYIDTDLDGLLVQLACRLETQSEFPHEIGIFLGYPLRDVIGFIENRGRNFTCCGFWKSYGNPAEMQVCFACYRKCIQTYVAMFEQGIPIERLAVPA